MMCIKNCELGWHVLKKSADSGLYEGVFSSAQLLLHNVAPFCVDSWLSNERLGLIFNLYLKSSYIFKYL